MKIGTLNWYDEQVIGEVIFNKDFLDNTHFVTELDALSDIIGDLQAVYNVMFDKQIKLKQAITHLKSINSPHFTKQKVS